MSTLRYCGPPTIGLGPWVRSRRAPATDLTPPATPPHPWPQLRERTVIGTLRGRTAIALAARLLGLGPGHEVLVPAYNCGSEIDALLHAGVRVVGYRVTARAEIDFAHLRQVRTARTRAVYVIHYFGWEQPLAAVRRWCDEEGLLLIEDCALALFSVGPSGLIGRLGDAAIYSLPKTFGCRQGGLLALRTPPAAEVRLQPADERAASWQEFIQVGRGTLAGLLDHLRLFGVAAATQRLSRWPRHLRRASARPTTRATALATMTTTRAEATPATRTPLRLSSFFDPARHAERALPARIAAVVFGCDADALRERRRAHYRQLQQALAAVPGLEPLYPELPEGVCPLSLPLLVSDRAAWVAALQAVGIAALPWWAGYHPRSIAWEAFPEACHLKDHILTLPVHQNLDAPHLAYLAAQVARVARTAAPRANTVRQPLP